MPYKEMTIFEAVEQMDHGKMYLPAIQRKYVWRDEQITEFMDSIMKGYPIGTFLFWKIKRKTIDENRYPLYHFIKNYHERDRYNNEAVGVPLGAGKDEDEKIISVLDGQQRLTSLYIALKGSLSLKLPKKRWMNDDAFPNRELYFDLFSEQSDEDDISYRFSFLTKEEAGIPNPNECWYKVKEIIQYKDLTDLNKLIRKSEWGENDTAANNITRLFEAMVKDKTISYFEVERDSIDEVLDIFVRVNSGGVVLSKTDLLFSTAVSIWNDGREKMDSLVAEINKIGKHYSFTCDFVMRACLYVLNLPVDMKVRSFKKDNVEKIQNNWPEIEKAIKETVELLNELGFSKENIVAGNAVLPVVYYRYTHGAEAFRNGSKSNSDSSAFDVKMEIRKYLVVSQLRQIFGKSTGRTLILIREELQKRDGKFRLSDLQDLKFPGEKKLSCESEDIESWMDYEKGAYTFMLLSLLYPNLKFSQNEFHQDHMHPYSAFNEKELERAGLDAAKIELWQHLRNTVPNLQLLEGRDNCSKRQESLAEWLRKPENRENVKYLPPNIDYSLANFEEYIEKRKALMMDELKRILR